MNKTTKTISYITIILLLSKLVGFAREMIIASYYGASWQTDAFNMANNIILLSTVILSMGVATVIVPMYNHRLVQNDKKEADAFASNILCITSVVYAVLSLLGIMLAPLLIKVFAPNFNEETALLAARLMRMMFMLTIGTNAVNFLSAVSRANKKFLIPALAGFPLSAMTAASIIATSRYIGIYAMVIGWIVSVLVQAVMLAVSLKGTFKFRAMLNFTNGDVKRVGVLYLPILFSIGVDQVNAVIDRMLASGLIEGSITAIGYAQKLRALPDGIITASIVSVIFPMLSQYAAKHDFSGLKSLVVRAMSTLFMVMLPITLACICYSREIVAIVYERGAFTHSDTLMTAHIFIFVVVSLFFIGGNNVLNNAFYGMQDTKTPRIGSVLAVMCNIVLNLILVRYMQAAGLALATSISTVVNCVILFVFFRRKCGAFGGMALVRTVFDCTVATAGMIPTFFLCENLRGTFPPLLFFMISVILGFSVYALLLFIIRDREFMAGMEKLKSFYHK